MLQQKIIKFNTTIDLIPAAVEAVKQETISKMELFSSVNKAGDSFDINKIVELVVKEVQKLK